MRFSGERYVAMRGLATEWVGSKKMVPCGATEWLSMAFPVPKKTPGHWRGVIDYRGVNLETKSDTYPLPRIGDILERQGQRHIWTVIDLKDAFSQIPMSPDSQEIIAIGTPIGVLKPRCMPQGLKNAPAVWQRVTEWVLRDVRDVADPYIDDIIVGTTQTEDMTDRQLVEQHYLDIRKVLDALADEKLVADGENTTFFARRVDFCGHTLSRGRREPSKGKLRSLEKWPVPTTVVALRGFLGFCNYYSEYVKGYGELVASLQEKLNIGREKSRLEANGQSLWTRRT
jgi:hypothetical protein